MASLYLNPALFGKYGFTTSNPCNLIKIRSFLAPLDHLKYVAQKDLTKPCKASFFKCSCDVSDFSIYYIDSCNQLPLRFQRSNEE
jgi:hypothetical protein